MTVYWLMFAVFALGAFLTRDKAVPEKEFSSPLLFVAILLVALMIGLRYQVGGDWENYDYLFDFSEKAGLAYMLSFGDPGYQLLNWAVKSIGAEIWVVNLVCGLIFAAGLKAFVVRQPNPWLGLLIALPYLIIVVAMGYTRQGVAIGAIMGGLASMQRGRPIAIFILFVAFAATFHKSAVLVLPLAIMAGQRTFGLNIIIGIAGLVLLYDVFLAQSVQGFMRNYVETQYASQGAAIRVAMALLPALIFLSSMKRFLLSDGERKLWRNFAIAAIILGILLVLVPSSTAIDRVALYILPLQIVVFTRLSYAFPKFKIAKVAIVALYFAIQLVWLNYADHSKYWVPYRVYPVF